MEATCTSQVFSRCQVHYWTPHILFSCDPYKSPQSSYYCLQFTEKITQDSASPKALHSLSQVTLSCQERPSALNSVSVPQTSISGSLCHPGFSLLLFHLLKIVEAGKGVSFSFLCFIYSSSLAL